MSAEPFPATDPGLELLAHLYATLHPGPEWCVTQPRGFTWWGHRLAQRVWAEPPQREGTPRCHVHVVSDVLREVPDTLATLEALNTANRFASLSSVVWDREQGRVSLRCSAEASAGVLAWLKPLLGWAATLQVSAAHVRARDLAEIFEAVIDASEHPTSGPREREADALATVWRLGLGSTGPTPYTRAELAHAVRALPRAAAVEWVEDLQVSVALPFAGAPPGSAGGATLLLAGEAEHLALGKGGLLRLKLPPGAGGDHLMAKANQLNLVEESEWTGFHHLGAWRRDPSRCLTFSTFLPRMVFQPGLLAELAAASVTRLAWVERQLARM